MKKILLLTIMFILLASFASAVVDWDQEAMFYYFNDSTGSVFIDEAGKRNATITGNASTCGDMYCFDGSDYITVPNHVDVGATAGFTISLWFNYGSTQTGVLWSETDEATSQDNSRLQVNTGTNDLLYRKFDGATSLDTTGVTGSLNNNTWRHLLVIKNSTANNYRMYLDGILEGTSGVDVITAQNSWQGFGALKRASISFFYNGKMMSMTLINRTLTLDEINNLTDSGRDFNPFAFVPPPPPPDINESIENTVLFKQVGSVLVGGSASFTTIMDNSFEILNATETYFAYSTTIAANSNNVAECQFLVDGQTQESNFNRTNIGGIVGNMHIVGSHSNLTVGNHSSSFQCRRQSGTGNFIVSETVGIGHLLIDEVGDALTHAFVNIDDFFFNSSTFIQIDSSMFNTSGKQNSSEIQRVLYMNWGSNIIHNSTGNITLMFSLDGVNCSEYVRFGSDSDSVSTGGNCLQRNFDANQSINMTVFIKGVGTIKHFHCHTTEFLVEPVEVNSTFLVNTNITSATPSLLRSIHIENMDHASVNIYVKAGLPVLSNSGNTSDSFQFRLSGDDIQNGTVFTKDLLIVPTILVPQDIFENVGIGNFTVELWGACDNANCSIVGGEMDAFISDLTTAVSQAFNLSVFDVFDDSSILNFTATTSDGTKFLTTVGFALVTSSLAFDNITVSSNFSGGYFDNTTVDHNVSNDLSMTLTQTIISFNSTELVTNNFLSDVNYSILGVTRSIFHLKAGSYNVTATKSGYFNLTEQIIIIPLQNETLPINGLFNLILNLTVKNRVTDVFVQNFSGTYLGVNTSFNSSFSTTNFSAFIPLIQNMSFNILLNSISGLADTGNFLNLTSANTTNVTLFNATILLWTNNSINFSIFNRTNSSLLLQNVNIFMRGSNADFDLNTSNGLLFVDGIVDDTYRITFESDGFTDTVLFATIGDNNHLDINVFMIDGVEKGFTVQDSFGDPIQDVICTFFENINGSSISIGQFRTDFSGRGTIFLDESVEYNFICAKSNFITFSGFVIPTLNEYIITMFETGLERFVSVFEDIIYFTSFSYVLNASDALATLTINSFNGELSFFGMNTTYRGTNFFVNTSGSPAGGTETFNITNIDPTIENFINITYFFQVSDGTFVDWSTLYFLSGLEPTNITIEGGWFDDLENLDRTDPVRGVVGFLIILLLIIIFSAATGDPFMGILGGVLGLALNWKFELMPRELLGISLIVIVALMLADNIGGRR